VPYKRPAASGLGVSIGAGNGVTSSGSARGDVFWIIIVKLGNCCRPDERTSSASFNCSRLRTAGAYGHPFSLVSRARFRAPSLPAHTASRTCVFPSAATSGLAADRATAEPHPASYPHARSLDKIERRAVRIDRPAKHNVPARLETQPHPSGGRHTCLLALSPHRPDRQPNSTLHLEGYGTRPFSTCWRDVALSSF
jgi:hypothetical protein